MKVFSRLLGMIDPDGRNLIKCEIPKQSISVINSFGDEGYEALVDAFISCDAQIKEEITISTIILDNLITPVFMTDESIIWDGVNPYIDNGHAYYFGLFRTIEEIEGFSLVNKIETAGKAIPWPRSTTNPDHFIFSTSAMINDPILGMDIIELISETRLANYARVIPRPDDKNTETLLKLAFLREMYCSSIDRDLFRQIEDYLISYDSDLSGMKSTFGGYWESCPYTHSLIDRYIISISYDTYERLIFDDIKQLIADIRMYNPGDDHSIIAVICAILIRCDYIYNNEREEWLRFNEYTRQWDVTRLDELHHQITVVLKDKFSSLDLYLSRNLYTHRSNNMETNDSEIRNSVESIFKKYLGKTRYAKELTNQLTGIQSMNIRNIPHTIPGLTKAGNIIVDFTNKYLIIREAVREDPIMSDCRTIVRREDLESLGCPIGKAKTLDPKRKQKYKLPLSKKYEPIYFNLMDVPMYVITMQMFFRENLDVTTFLVNEFWKRLASPFTGSLIKQVVHLCGPRGFNGKSTFVKILKRAVGHGKYGDVSLSMLMEEPKTQGPTSNYIVLKDKYYGIISESDGYRNVKSHILKLITGGDDVPMREMYGKQQAPSLNLVLLSVGNNPFTVDNVDDPVRRRTDYFVATGQYSYQAPKSIEEQWEVGIFPIDEGFDMNIKRMESLAQQTFLLLIYFAQKYLEEGKMTNQDMNDYKEYYLSGSNPQIMFIKEFLVESPGSTLLIQDVYNVFCKWFTETYIQKRAPRRDIFVAQLRASFSGYLITDTLENISFTEAASVYMDVSRVVEPPRFEIRHDYSLPVPLNQQDSSSSVN